MLIERSTEQADASVATPVESTISRLSVEVKDIILNLVLQLKSRLVDGKPDGRSGRLKKYQRKNSHL